MSKGFWQAGIIVVKTTTFGNLNDAGLVKKYVMNAFEKRKGKWHVIASHETLPEAKEKQIIAAH